MGCMRHLMMTSRNQFISRPLGIIFGFILTLLTANAFADIQQNKSHCQMLLQISPTKKLTLSKDYAPLVQQKTNYTCGPASLLSWLISLGISNYDENSLATVLNTNSEYGTSYQNFISGLNQLEIAAVFKINQSVESLRQYLRKGYGVIVSTQVHGEGHWALLVDISEDGQTLTLMDPWYANKGYRKIKRSDFESRWFDYFSKNREFKERGALVLRPPND